MSVLGNELYTPLESDSIRVLKIIGTCLVEQPNRPSDLAIECSLEPFHLSEARAGRQAYHALSYVWGSPRFPRWIVCNGIRKAVTANLYEALWHLTFRDKTHELPLLWIDAICINQADDSDKQQQVSLMASIYREAEKVIVWLGTDAASNPRLEEFWTRLTSEGARQTVKHKAAFDRGVAYIKDADWFTRVWTLQEIVLAKRAEVHCGFSSVDWHLLTEFSAFADAQYVERKTVEVDNKVDRSRSSSVSSEDSFLPDFVPISLFPGVELILRLSYYNEGGKRTLYDLIRAARFRDASDSRDKVYSLIGLLEPKSFLQPDYSLSTEQVFANMALAIFEEQGWLWMNLKKVPPLQFSEHSHAVSKRTRTWQPLLTAEKSVPQLSWIPDLRDIDTYDGNEDAVKGSEDDWAFQGPEWTEPRFDHLHPEFVPNFKLSDTNIIARGVLLGCWSRFSRNGSEQWQYEGDGALEGFPACVLDFAKQHLQQDTEILSLSTSAIYQMMKKHVEAGCSCDAQQGTAKLVATNAESAKAVRAKAKPKKDSSEVEKNRLDRWGWLCFLFGKAEPLVLVPVRSQSDPSTIVFKIANRLPYKHYWATQVVHASANFRDNSSHDVPGGARNLMADTLMQGKKDRGSRGHEVDQWHMHLSKVNKQPAANEQLGRGALDHIHSRLSLAFHEGSVDQKEQLKMLEQKYPQMPRLQKCHLNWIPTTFEIVG